MREVRIAGGGLAGSAAALAVCRSGGTARVWDPVRTPRQKVCGEFLTPEIETVLAGEGLWTRFLAEGPARMQRMELVFGSRRRSGRLPSAAFGLSRDRLDGLLRAAAAEAGTKFQAERAPAVVDVVAHGRAIPAVKGNRTFGFKAHFEGPVSDAVELYFFGGCYVGVNPVEGGRTNVCGLGPESVLRRFGYDFDRLTGSEPALAERLRPMRRVMEWHTTGPLVYGPTPGGEGFRAGDALQFIDPFTGTGMTIAIWTGLQAGRAALEGARPQEFHRRVLAGLGRQRRWCGALRQALRFPPLTAMAPLVPTEWLYQWTRPRLEGR